jgi:hypothetical protein
MRQADFQKFRSSLTAVAELYSKPLSEAALALWWDALQRFDATDVERALRATIQDPDGGQFMPRPADLIRRLEGTASDRALIAWGKVLEAMRRVGAYASVVFDDGLIHAAIDDMGGWPTVCRSTVEELPFIQKRFCDTFRAYSKRPDVRYPQRLAGEHEAVNALRGQPVAKPVLIGDQAKALEVAAGGAAGGRLAIGTMLPERATDAEARRALAGLEKMP